MGLELVMLMQHAQKKKIQSRNTEISVGDEHL